MSADMVEVWVQVRLAFPEDELSAFVFNAPGDGEIEDPVPEGMDIDCEVARVSPLLYRLVFHAAPEARVGFRVITIGHEYAEYLGYVKGRSLVSKGGLPLNELEMVPDENYQPR